MSELNRETGDHTKPVAKHIGIQLGGQQHEFDVWMSRYTFDHMTHEDWMTVGRRLKAHADAVLRRACLDGSWFDLGGQQRVRASVEQAARRFAYEVFRASQQAAGNLQWQVDSLLSGAEYRV